MRMLLLTAFLALSVPFTAAQWSVTVHPKSKIDDHVDVDLATRALQPVHGWLSSSRPQLVVRCSRFPREEEPIEVTILIANGTHAEVEGSRLHTVRFRFGKDDPTTEYWSESTDGLGLFAPDDWGLLVSLLENRSVVYSFTPFRREAAETAFNLSGLRDAMRRNSVCRDVLDSVADDERKLAANRQAEVERTKSAKLAKACEPYQRGPRDNMPRECVPAIAAFDEDLKECKKPGMSSSHCLDILRGEWATN